MARMLFSRVLRILCASAALLAAYCLLLSFPQPFFAYSVKAGNLVLHADAPFPEEAGRIVLRLAAAKLARSPLASQSLQHHVYLCQARWRQRLFFNIDYGVGGVAPYPFSPNVFLRDAGVADNRLIGPSGNPVPGDRTLDYYIAHEVTHQLTGRALGPFAYARLPQWVREGYADYVGKGIGFQYEEAKKALLANDAAMDWQRSGLYLRFHLLVAHSLDKRGITVGQLLTNPPQQETVEAEVRAGVP